MIKHSYSFSHSKKQQYKKKSVLQYTCSTMTHHFIYTVGIPLPQGGELYQFDGERSKLGSTELPIGQFYLTRPLITTNNPITTAKKDTRFGRLIVRQYDRFGNMLKLVEYNDVRVLQLVDGSDLIMEFTYKP